MFKKIFPLILLYFISFSMYITFAQTNTFSLGEVESQETIIVEDITYNKYIIDGEGNDTHIIHNLELGRYSDFEIVLHDRLYGEDAMGLSTVLNIALDYEAKTGKVVYAAVNGDFFSDLPIDFYAVNNNILRIGHYDKNAFGFTDAHKTRIGDVEFGYKINIYNDDGSYNDYIHIDKMNQELEDGDIGVFTPDFTSKISGSNIAKLSVSNEDILNNSEFHYEGNVLTDINNFDFNNDTYQLSSNEFIIAAKNNSQSYDKIIDRINTGTRISIYPYPINDWKGMKYIIGGWQILLDRGQKLPEEIHGSITSRHPRTTIGVNRDGVIGLTVINGRLVNIPGLTLNELADLNEDLGYYTALELDGGGSSTCLLRNLETDELEVMNTPADGHLRKVVNAVLIVGDPIETNEPIITEITTETITTTEQSTYRNPITTITQTTEHPTITTTTLQETISSNLDVDNASSCSSCSNVSSSLFFLAFISFFTFIIYRKK